jgi:hypothetical protein
MNIVICVILGIVVLNLLFTIRISMFLVNFVDNLQKRLNEMNDEPPIAVSRNSRQLNEDSGLIDIQGVPTYDPRFTDPDF